MSSAAEIEANDFRVFNAAMKDFLIESKKIKALATLRAITERNGKALKLLWYTKDVVNKLVLEVATLFEQAQQPNFPPNLTVYGCQIISIFVYIAKEEDLLQAFVHSQIPLKLTHFLKVEYGAPTSFFRFPLLGLVLTVLKSQEPWAPQWLVTTEVFPNLLSAALNEKNEVLDVSIHAITEFIGYEYGLNYLARLSPRVFAVDAVLRNVILNFATKTFTSLRERILYRCVLFCYCRLFRDVRIGCLLHDAYPDLVQHLSQPYLYEDNLDCTELLRALKDSVKAAEDESVRRQKEASEIAEKQRMAMTEERELLDSCAELMADLRTPLSKEEKVALGMQGNVTSEEPDDDDVFQNNPNISSYQSPYRGFDSFIQSCIESPLSPVATTSPTTSVSDKNSSSDENY